MIETCFLPGLKLQWKIPGNYIYSGMAPAGSIIDNPNKTVPMRVAGLVSRANKNPTHHRKAKILSGSTIPHSWLVYAPKYTSRIHLTGSRDILTGPMSGCIIALWNENGKNYVGHIGTELAGGDANKLVKANFAMRMPQNAIGFDPAKHINFAQLATIQRNLSAGGVKGTNPQTYALVTASKNFYTLVLYFSNDDFYYVGPCTKVQPMRYQALRSALGGRGALVGVASARGSKFL